MGIDSIPDDMIAKYEDDLHFLELILDKKGEASTSKINRADYYYEGGILNKELDSKGMEIRLKAGTTKQSFVKNLEDTRQILRIFKGLFKEDKYHYWGQLLRAEVDSSIQLYSNQEFKVYKFQLYTGEFIEGKRSGSGQLKIFKQDGDTNLREIINSQPSYHYEGEFLLNKKEGMGKETNDDGEVYDGEFSNGKRNGKGNLTNKELTYQGEFENGQFNGEGSCNWKDGRAYMGEWSEGFKHGRGEFLWPDGRIYKGVYVKG